MKARLNPFNRLSKKEIELLDQYIRDRAMKIYDDEATGLVQRCYKTFAVALHKKHHFGRRRIVDLFEILSDISELRDKDEVFWQHLDDILINELKIPIQRENYEDLDR